MGTEQRVPRKTMAQENNDVTSGWDPYEVWRTRVFIPRAAAEAVASPAPTAPVAALLVVAQADGTSDDAAAVDWPLGRNDHDALKHELIDVISSLCLAGLTSIWLNSSERRSLQYARRSRRVSPLP